MIRDLFQADERLKFSLFFDFSRCPAGCGADNRLERPGCVYRSSRRSVTLRCTRCGLLWTMTVHQIAKVAARLATLRGEADIAAASREQWAAAWAEWAACVPERRGRRRPPSVTP
jgi:hypothetical protein